MFGIYIHIPFCKSFCNYCDFYSTTDCNNKASFIDALKQEISRRAKLFKGVPYTLYIGGGTPSLLTIEELSSVIQTLEDKFDLSKLKEFTIEVNPDDIDLGFANDLRKLGVNRVSMGIQSFDEYHLKWMHRRHTAAQAINAYYSLRDSGIENISLDLIFGYVAEGENENISFDKWNNDINEILKLHPEHISAYQMSIEPGSMLALSGNYIEPTEEFCAQEYRLLQDRLYNEGYIQYEISNFSLCGYKSKHNSSYWDRIPYLGLGPAAHSFDGKRRSWNPSDIVKYNTNAYKGWDNEYSEVLSKKEILEEKIMLGLRRVDGVILTSEEANLLKDEVSKLSKRGVIISENGGTHLRIPPKYFFISDSIISELFI